MKRTDAVDIDWHGEAHRLFEEESDRGAALVVTAMLDVALEHVLAARLLPAVAKERDVFGSAGQGPLGTFSAKIDMGHQLGLISPQFARDLHFIRKIRNEFAHHPLDRAFDDQPVCDWVRALEKASDYNRLVPRTRRDIGPAGVRWDFLGIASWMLYHLQREVEVTERLNPAKPEFGYIPELMRRAQIVGVPKGEAEGSDTPTPEAF